MVSLSACVLPLAPEFEDPPAARNFAPFIIDSLPVNGAVVSSKMFRVTVTDPNISDDLYVRWIADYPPFLDSKSRRLGDDIQVAHSQRGTPLQFDSTIMLDCVLHSLAKIVQQHQIMVIVADRPFLPPEQETSLDKKLTSLPMGEHSAEAHWTLDLECQ